MADVDSNLVQAIAAQVMLALKAGMRGDAPEGVNAPVDVHAPIGICTGDYSKFPELRGLQISSGPEGLESRGASSMDGTSALPPPSASNAALTKSFAAAVTGASASAATALKGVITVSNLRAIKGPIRLAKGAILTPLAQDFIKDRGLTIMTDEAAAAVRVNGGAVSNTAHSPVMWWIDGQCPAVAKVVETLRPGFLASRERGSGENLRAVIKEISAQVKGKKISGGILFVPSAARAICYANRCQSLRAIVATNDRAVSEGIELLGANVLVVEYPAFGFAALLALVKPFVESAHAVAGAVQKELDDLRTCG